MPDWSPEIERRLAGLRLPAEREAEITEELCLHLADRYRELLEEGSDPEHAYRRSLDELSEEGYLEQQLRRIERGNTSDAPVVGGTKHKASVTANVVQDLRYAVRVLAKAPAFTTVSIIALALGIGANTAVFSVVNGVLLKPLPYPDPDRLIWISPADLKTGERWPGAISPPDFVDYRQQGADVFEHLSAFLNMDLTLTGSGEPERVPAAGVSAGFFETLGIMPVMGRSINAEDEQEKWPKVALLSDGLWRRRFGGDPGILGKTVIIDGKGVTVIGIMPGNFAFPKTAQIWQPLPMTYAELKVRRFHFLRVIGRLRPGVSIEQAQAKMTAICSALAKLYPDSNESQGAKTVRLLDEVAGDLRPTLVMLMFAVAFVLLIACANVAHLLLARAASRRKEIAIRMSLGASGGRIVTQLMTESVLLAAAGGICGLMVAAGGLRALVALHPVNIPRLEDVGLDIRVLAFTAAISILTGFVFGLIPALQATRPQLTSTLKEGGRAASAGRARRRFHNVLAAVEVAIAVVLLAGAGLMLRSFQKLENVNPGFDPSGVLTMRVDLPMDPGAANENVQPDEVLKNDKTGPFFNELLQRLRTLPGVEYAGAVSELPLSGMNNDTWFTIEGRPPLKPSDRPNADQRRATPDYFKAMSIPLLKGRYFTDADNRTAAKVLIINQALADKFFPSQDPIGQHLVVDFGFPFRAEIIGVVGNVRHRSLASKPRQELYASYLQGIGSRMNIVVRTRSNPMSLAGAVKRQVEALNRDVPVFAIHTMDDLVSDSVGRPRFRAVLLGAFAALALLLAAAGIYGIMSYSVTQRTHELGVRVALGAGWWDVMSLVVGRGLLLALTGVAAGLAAALALARLIASMLYDVAPSDPASFVTVSLVLLAVAFLANYIAARRAAQVDPVVALRDE